MRKRKDCHSKFRLIKRKKERKKERRKKERKRFHSFIPLLFLIPASECKPSNLECSHESSNENDGKKDEPTKERIESAKDTNFAATHFVPMKMEIALKCEEEKN